MDFGANKTPAEVIKERAFGETYFKDIYPSINGRWYRKSRKGFNELKNVGSKYCCSYYYDLSVNKYGVRCGTSLRSGKTIVGLNPWILMAGFSRWLGRTLCDNERQIARWKGIVSRFKGKLVKMIKGDGNNKCMNFSVDDEKLLEAYNAYNVLWDKISNLLEKGFDCEPVCDNKHIRTKIKSYNKKMNTHFQSDKIPEGVRCASFSIILLDSFVKVDLKNIICKQF